MISGRLFDKPNRLRHIWGSAGKSNPVGRSLAFAGFVNLLRQSEGIYAHSPRPDVILLDLKSSQSARP